MKQYIASILKALGLTVGLNVGLLLFLRLAAPLAMIEIGQVILLGVVILMQITAACLYAAIPTPAVRTVWLCVITALPLHLMAAIASALVYGNRLSSFWPGSFDLAWLVFLILITVPWALMVVAIALARTVRMGIRVLEEKRQAKQAAAGFCTETEAISPARARFIAGLKGLIWVLAFHILTGILLEILVAMDIADTLLGYTAFPCLWCLMAAVYGLLDGQNRVTFGLSVAITHILVFALVMLFLIPANVTQHVGYALLYLDGVLTQPYEHVEQLLILIQFLMVWPILLIFGIAHGHRKAPGHRRSSTDPNVLFVEQEEE